MPEERLDILVDLKDFASKEFRKLRGTVGRFGSFTTGTFKAVGRSIFSLKGLLAGLGVALTGKAVFDMVRAVSAAGDQFQKLSIETGVSTEALSELKFAADRSGASFDDLKIALRTGIRNLAQFATLGKGEAASAMTLLSEGFRRMVKDGTPLEELLPFLSEELKGLAEQDRVFVASKLFGESGSRLIPLLTSDIKAVREEAHRFGLTITQEAADAAAKFEDATTNLRAALTGLRNQAIIPLLPMLTDFTETITDGLVNKRPEILRFFADFVEGSGEVGRSVVATIGELETSLGKITELQLQTRRFALGLAFAAENAAGGASGAFPGADAESLRRAKQQSEDRKKVIAEEIALVDRLLLSTEERQKEIAGVADSIKSSADAAAQRIRALADDIGRTLGDEIQEVSSSLQRGEIDVTQFAATIQEKFGITGPQIAANAEEAEKLRVKLRAVAEESRRVAEETDRKNQALADEEQRIRIETNALEGAKEQLRIFKEESQQFGVIAAQAITQIHSAVSSQLSTAIVDVITQTRSAKDAFKDFAKAVLTEIARIIVQLIVANTLKAALGSLGGLQLGGVTTGSSRPAGAQFGGVFQRRTLLEVAEGGTPEAVVPLRGGRIPLELRRRGGELVPFVPFPRGGGVDAQVFDSDVPRARAAPSGGRAAGSGGGLGGGTVINTSVNFYHSYTSPLDERRLLERNKATIVEAVVEANNSSLRTREGLR